MPAPMGNSNRAGAAAINRVLLDCVRSERFDLLKKGVQAQLKRASEGDLNSLAWIYDRIVGRAVAQVEVSQTDARELDLSSLAALILQHRRSQAVDLQAESAPLAIPADPPGTP